MSFCVLHNRDAGEELRIKKTVDAWINTLNKEIQVSLTLCPTLLAQLDY